MDEWGFDVINSTYNTVGKYINLAHLSFYKNIIRLLLYFFGLNTKPNDKIAAANQRIIQSSFQSMGVRRIFFKGGHD